MRRSCVLFARKTYGVMLTEDRARELKAQWLERWPEMRLFFKHVGRPGRRGHWLRPSSSSSSRIATQWLVHYSAWPTRYFQGLGADAAKRAHYLVARACYAEPASVLYGSRPVNFVHDESILEVDDDVRAHDKAIELGRLMVLGANEFLPNVPARVEPLLARRWSKKSKPVFKDGRLVPWEFAEKANGSVAAPVQSTKDRGPRRPCPTCGDLFQETMPLGSGDSVVWVPRPVCTKHGVDKNGRPTA